VDASLLVSIAAVLIAIGAAINERRHRKAELDILRDQLDAQVRAEMYAEPGEIRWAPAVYNFRVGNAGPAVARNIRLWMRAGDTTAGAVVLEPMIPGHHEPLRIELGQPLAYTEGVRTKAELVCSWTDNSGNREEVLVSDLPSGT
jgi:hypothetical protein